MIKKFLAIFLLLAFCFQANVVFAIEANNVTYHVQRLDKEQYPHKKVIKKYDPYLLTLVNKDKKSILANADSEILLFDENDNSIVSETRREAYRNTRRRDIGKSYSIGVPCALVSGAIIGFTFGLGIPVAIGVMILGNRPARKAAQENYQIAEEIYQSRGLPLRFEPQEINQLLLLVPKKEKLSKVTITNVMYENNVNKKFDLTIDLTKMEY